MDIGWIYYGFSGAIANFVVWISLFFPVWGPRQMPPPHPPPPTCEALVSLNSFMTTEINMKYIL
jgi:hypothetical protein